MKLWLLISSLVVIAGFGTYYQVQQGNLSLSIFGSKRPELYGASGNILKVDEQKEMQAIASTFKSAEQNNLNVKVVKTLVRMGQGLKEQSHNQASREARIRSYKSELQMLQSLAANHKNSKDKKLDPVFENVLIQAQKDLDQGHVPELKIDPSNFHISTRQIMNVKEKLTQLDPGGIRELDQSSHTCTNQSFSDPSTTGDPLDGEDGLTLRTTAIQNLATQMGATSTVDAATRAFFYVRDNIKLEHNFGASQSAERVAYSKMGSSIDKATLLVTLLRTLEIPAVYRVGEAFVTEERIKKFFGVEGSWDLLWAYVQTLGGYFKADGSININLMSYRRDGKKLWVLPHAWVLAYIDGDWVELDPSNIVEDGTEPEFNQRWLNYTFNYEEWLFDQDSEGRYIKPGTVAEQMMRVAPGVIRDDFGLGYELSDLGFFVRGKEIFQDENELPIGNISSGSSCIEGQSALLDENYVFKSRIQLKQPNGTVIIDEVIPSYQTSEQLVYFRHSQGLFSASGNQSGQIQLVKNTTVLEEAPGNSGDTKYLRHVIIKPVRYGEDSYERVSDQKAGAVSVINHFISPVNEEIIIQELNKVKADKIANVGDVQLMARFLKLAAVMAAKKDKDSQSLLDKMYGSQSASLDLVNTYTEAGIVLDRDDRALGMIPTGAQIDWQSFSTLYSRSGNKSESKHYSNLTQVFRAGLVSGSAIEHQIWEELYGVPAVSTVKILQEAARQRSLGASFDIIEGELLSNGNDSSIYGRLGPGMSQHIPAMKAIQANQKLYSITQTLRMNSGWEGIGYLMLPEDIFSDGKAAFLTYVPGISDKGGGMSDESEDVAKDVLNNGRFGFISCLPVVIANGSMFHQFRDFELKGRTSNTNILFERTYYTNLKDRVGDFGPGWAHNWETKITSPGVDQLNTTSTGNIVWTRADGLEINFERQLDNSFEPQSGYFEVLNEYNDRYELRLKGGAVMEFSRGLGTVPPGRLAKLRDPHGEEVVLGYASGRLSSIESGLAGEVTILRNGSGRITSVTRERDLLTYTYDYNGDGKLISSKDFENNETTYTYVADRPGTQAQGLMDSFTDPLVRTTSFVYYDNGQVFEENAPGGYKQVYQYAHFLTDRLSRVKDVQGNLTLYRLDEDFRVVETTFDDGGKVLNEWSDNNLLLSTTDELGFKTEYTYDSRGNRNGVKRPEDSDFTEMVYDQVFDIPSEIDPLIGGTTNRTIDQDTGDITRVERVGSSSTLYLEYTYDTFGNVLQTTNNRDSYSNDTNVNGLAILLYDARNPETRSYDDRGRLEVRQFANGRTLTMTYDDFDRVLTIVDSHGPDLTNEYETVGSLGRLIKRTLSDGNSANDQETTFVYDERDRLISTTDPEGRTTQTSYDALGLGCRVIDKPREIKDPANRITRFTYDERTRLVRTIDPRGGVTRFEYNQRGDRIAVTDAEGNRTRFRYDGNGRVITRERPTVRVDNKTHINSTEITNYIYDDLDRVTRQQVELPSLEEGSQKGYFVTTFEYDEFDRLKRRKQFKEGPGPLVLETYEDSQFTYETNLESPLIKTANNEKLNINFAYEATPPFAMTGFENAAAQGGNPLNLIEGTYTITPEVENAIGLVQKDSNTIITRDYDPAGRLTSINSSFESNDLDTVIAYDSFGRKLTVTNDNGLVGSYDYDKLNRITEVDWSGASENMSEVINYHSQTGNVSTLVREVGTFTYTYDNTDQLTQVGFTGTSTLHSSVRNRTFNYDLTGNRATDSRDGTTKSGRNIIMENGDWTFYNDVNGLGRVSQKSSKNSNYHQLFKYRSDGKLISFIQYNGSSKNADIQYHYDALGRRIAKQNFYGSSFTQTYSHLADQDKILVAQKADLSQTLFIDGLGIDEHIGKINSSSALAFVTDRIGTVINEEVVSDKKITGPFGESNSPLSFGSSGQAVQYGYTGRQYDPESGDYYYRARNYSPDMGRFTTSDPTGFSGVETNMYRYVLNRPVLLVDSLGLYANSLDVGATVLNTTQGIEMLIDSYVNEAMDKPQPGQNVYQVAHGNAQSYRIEYKDNSLALSSAEHYLYTKGEVYESGLTNAAIQTYSTTLYNPIKATAQILPEYAQPSIFRNASPASLTQMYWGYKGIIDGMRCR